MENALTKIEIAKALEEAFDIFGATLNQCSKIEDHETREEIYTTIASCTVAIAANVIFSLYRNHDESLEEFAKQTERAIATLKKQHFAKKVKGSTPGVTLQ